MKHVEIKLIVNKHLYLCHLLVLSSPETQNFYLQYSTQDQWKFYADKLHTGGVWDLAT